MSSYLVQGGTTLYDVTLAGVATAITLPSGFALTDVSTPCRAVVFTDGSAPILVIANGATHDFIVSGTTAYPLQISAPASAPTLSTGNYTTSSFTPNRPSSDFPSGTYMVAASYKRKNASGQTVFESTLGPASPSFTTSGTNSLLVTGMPLSADTSVNARGIYRTLTNGNTFYPWFDIDDNVTTNADRYGGDAELSLLPSTTDSLGSPPDLKLITVWKRRLWGIPRVDFDILYWSEDGLYYAWPVTNSVVVPPKSSDNFGVTAFIPRRDQLGIARRDQLHQITGDTNDNFTRTQVSPNIGCVSQESVVVVRDVAYWLAERGVVEWTAEYCAYVSEAQVDPWFTTDEYFNRAMFSSAQGRYNPDTDSYELMLATVGSSSLNAWVSFDLKRRAWYGPHTSQLPLTICGTDTERKGYLRNSSDFPIAVFGTATGYLERRDPTVADDDNQSVTMDAMLPVLGGFAPELEKVWADPTIHSRVETKGTLSISSSVGQIGVNDLVNDPAPVTSIADLTQSFQRIDRPGTGEYLSFRVQHAAVGEFVRIYGIEVPYVIVGKRGR